MADWLVLYDLGNNPFLIVKERELANNKNSGNSLSDSLGSRNSGQSPGDPGLALTLPADHLPRCGAGRRNRDPDAGREKLSDRWRKQQ